MPKKHNKRRTSTQEQRSALKKLREGGLYKPKKPRGEVTDYAVRLIGKFSDFLSGVARAVKAPRKELRKFIGREKISSGVRAHRQKLVVPVQKGEHAFYSSKRERVEVVRQMGRDRYIRTPFEQRPTTWESIKRQLGANDRIVIPIQRGKGRAVEWQSFNAEDFEEFWQGGYGAQEIEGSVKDFRHRLRDHIQIFRFEGASAPKEPARMKPHEVAKARVSVRNERMSEIMDRIIAKRRKP